MSYPPILNIQSLNKVKDDCTLGTPSAAKAIKAALKVVCNIPDNIQQGHRLGNGSDVVEVALRAAFIPQAIDPPPTPSVAPLSHSARRVRLAHQTPRCLLHHFSLGPPFHSPILHTLNPPAFPQVKGRQA
jgi:hypothetical protein